MQKQWQRDFLRIQKYRFFGKSINSEDGIFLGIKHEPQSNPASIKISEWGEGPLAYTMCRQIIFSLIEEFLLRF